MTWIVSYTKPPEVVPIDDIKTHRYGGECWCQPFTDGFGTIVHNSADGREAYERGERKPH